MKQEKRILLNRANDLSVLFEVEEETIFANVVIQMTSICTTKDHDYKLPKELRHKVVKFRNTILEAMQSLSINDLNSIKHHTQKIIDTDAQEDLVNEALSLINKR